MNDLIVVIGAGIGGLTAAIRLAAAGYRVVVLEQGHAVGGKMAEVREEGFRWDTGPSVITMRHVMEDLFATAGRRLDDYLTLLPVEPLTRYFYPDSTVLDATRDLSSMAQQIARIDEQDVEGYLAYLSYAARIHRITGPVFIYDHPPTWRSFLRVPARDAIQVEPWRSMDAKIRRFVRSAQMRQLLGRFATYAGSSPYQASTTLNSIAHVELTGGVWYPKGGVFRVATALERLARELGVEIRLRSPVQEVAVTASGGPPSASAVILATGERLPARAVVANVDVTTFYEKIMPRQVVRPATLSRLQRQEPSCSGFILLLGVEGSSPDLAHHNIFFSPDYPREFDQLFRQGRPPEDPTIYVAITSKTDPDHAPPGSENWFVLVNAPALDDRFDWHSHAQAYGQLVLDRLAARGLDVRDRIGLQRMITPIDLARHTAARRGALYGMSFNSLWAPFRRPGNRSSEVNHLYFVGGTTHPGGGVPMVMLSGKVVSEMVQNDLER